VLPVNVVVLVDRLDRQHCLSNIEPSLILRKGILSHQQRHHVASGKVLHYEVQVLLILRAEVLVVRSNVTSQITVLLACTELLYTSALECPPRTTSAGWL
jgi:hypothetical protein